MFDGNIIPMWIIAGRLLLAEKPGFRFSSSRSEDDFPDLLQVLPEVESGGVPVFLPYPDEFHHSKQVAAFRDFVAEDIIAHRKRQQA